MMQDPLPKKQISKLMCLYVGKIMLTIVIHEKQNSFFSKNKPVLQAICSNRTQICWSRKKDNLSKPKLIWRKKKVCSIPFYSILQVNPIDSMGVVHEHQRIKHHWVERIPPWRVHWSLTVMVGKPERWKHVRG